MAIEWKLQDLLKAHGIANSSQLEAVLADRLGIRISRVALDKLIKKQPVSLRLETAQLLCNLFQLPLQDFLVITPEPVILHSGGLIQPYGRQIKTVDVGMVDPGQFF
jgi:hypothetical protein